MRDAGYSVPHGAYYPCEKGARPGGIFAYGTDAKGTPAGILVQMATFGNICDKEQISAALRPFVVRVRDVNSHDHDVSGTVLVDGMDCHENQWMIMLPVAVSLDALLPCEGTRGKIPAIAKASRTNFAEGVYEKYANLVRALRANPKLAKQVYFDVVRGLRSLRARLRSFSFSLLFSLSVFVPTISITVTWTSPTSRAQASRTSAVFFRPWGA